MTLHIEGETHELPLQSLDDEFAYFGGRPYRKEPQYTMPREDWYSLERPLNLRVIIQLIPKETT